MAKTHTNFGTGMHTFDFILVLPAVSKQIENCPISGYAPTPSLFQLLPRADSHFRTQQFIIYLSSKQTKNFWEASPLFLPLSHRDACTTNLI